MRTFTTLARSTLLAAGALILAACGIADEEPPANEGNTAGTELDMEVDAGEAVPAPEGMEDDVDVPINDDPGVTPNTVDGVGTGDATDEGLDY